MLSGKSSGGNHSGCLRRESDGAKRDSVVCSGPSTGRPLWFYKRPAPLATAGGDLEREMVSSRLLLIARRCAGRCNRIPAATRRKGEGTRCASVCVFLRAVCVCARASVYLLSSHVSTAFNSQESVAQRQASNNTANRLALNVVRLRRHRALWCHPAASAGLQHRQPKCQGYLLDFLTDRTSQLT